MKERYLLMAVNPELEFKLKSLATYDGMRLDEYSFVYMENYKGEQQEYKLDVIAPLEKSEAPRPVVIFVHGGGFTQPCDKRQAYIPMFAHHLTKAGYVGISPDYPIFDDPEQRAAYAGADRGAARAAEAVHMAYLYIQQNADALHLDTDRIALFGGSAGGMTGFYMLEHYSDKIRMFGNCWGAPRGYMPDVTKFPPTLSIHGTADQAVPYELEAPIQAAFEAAGVDHELLTLEGAPHTPLMHLDDFIPTVLAWLEKTMK